MKSAFELLIQLASPRGPGGSHHLDSDRQGFLSGDPVAALNAIVQSVLRRSDLPPELSVKEFEGEAAELLSDLAQHDEVVDRLVTFLADPQVRSVIIDGLALAGNIRAGPALAAIAKEEAVHSTMDEDESIRLVSALGCVGGRQAFEAVKILSKKPSSSVLLERELQIALQTLKEFG